MKSPKLPAGTIPAGATHFYFDRKRTTSVSNPWRRLDEDGNWHMLRGVQWCAITGTKKHNFFAIADVLPGGGLLSEGTDEPLMTSDATLRDYFAGMAMQGFLSGPMGRVEFEGDGDVACLSYIMADAMLAAREVTK